MDRLSVSNRAGSLGRSALTEQLSLSLLNKIAARDGREYNEMSRQRLGLFDFYASKFFPRRRMSIFLGGLECNVVLNALQTV